MRLALLSIALNAVAQILMKILAKKGIQIGAVLRQPYIYGVFIIYAISALLWFFALRTYPLGKAYPLQSLGYIVVTVTAVIVLNENASWFTWIGLGLIVMGAIVISK